MWHLLGTSETLWETYGELWGTSEALMGTLGGRMRHFWEPIWAPLGDM